jgi:hypothetical protein
MRLAGLLCIAALCGTSFADSMVFSDRATFLAATAATDATGPLPVLPAIGPGFSHTVGTVTLSTATSSIAQTLHIGGDYTARFPGNDIAVSGVEHVNAQFAGPVYAAGFDFVEPETDPNVNAPFVDSTFQVTLLLGGVPLAGAAFTFNAPNDTAWFVGVWSDAAFDRIEVRELDNPSTDLNQYENEFFGRFYSGTTALPSSGAAVPEPAAALLVLCGLAPWLARRRR